MAEETPKKIELKENQELNKYMEELAEDVKLSMNNIREKSLTVSTIRSKWLGYLFKERENLSRIKDARARILKQGAQATSALRLKSEDQMAQGDERLQRLSTLQKTTESNLDYIERALNILNDFSWQIRNLVEVLKLEGMS